MPKQKEKFENSEKSESKPEYDTNLIIDLLFKQVEKPKNCTRVNVRNIYDNRFRINVWTTNEVNGLDISKIEQSYFAKFVDNTLII